MYIFLLRTGSGVNSFCICITVALFGSERRFFFETVAVGETRREKKKLRDIVIIVCADSAVTGIYIYLVRVFNVLCRYFLFRLNGRKYFF